MNNVALRISLVLILLPLPLTATALVIAADDAVGARQFVREIVAHRGLSSDRPENTVASIQRAIEIGATAVEVDVRITKDDQLVILHDATLDRTTNGKGPVRQATLAEVRALDAGRWFDPKYAGEKIPTLMEVLAVCRGRIDLLLDLKVDGEDFANAVVAEVKTHGEPARTIVGVRSVEQARQFRQLLPAARQLGLIAKPDDLERYVAAGVPMIRLWPKWLTDDSLVERVRRTGAKLHLNTELGKPMEVLPLLKHHPDSMSSNDPAQLIATLAAAPAESYAVPKKSRGYIPVIIDTDIGSSIDDVFALALAFASPELDVRAITTVGSQADDRAWMACRFLREIGQPNIPVAAGDAPVRPTEINAQMEYRRHASLTPNSTPKPSSLSAVELLYQELQKDNVGDEPEKKPRDKREIKTLIALGPLTNIAKLLEKHPDCEVCIRRIVIMGGAIRVGYDGKTQVEAEWNIATDIPAARKVFQSKVPITLIPLDATATVKLEKNSLEKIFAIQAPFVRPLKTLYDLANDPTPILFDPVAIAAALPNGIVSECCHFEQLQLEIDDQGFTRITPNTKDGKRIDTATSVDRDRFIEWYVNRLAKAS